LLRKILVAAADICKLERQCMAVFQVNRVSFELFVPVMMMSDEIACGDRCGKRQIDEISRQTPSDGCLAGL